jgi:tetratricopeptide (TPR) repeat protein
MYLPSLGFSIAAAVGLHALAQRVGTSEARRRQALVTITAIVVALHGARAVERSLDWRTENGLYVHDLSVNPRSAKIQSNGGAALAEMGRHEEALVCYTAAIAIAPEFAPPYRGSVLALLALERYDEAHAMYQETLRFGPPVPSIEQTIREGQRQAARDARS